MPRKLGQNFLVNENIAKQIAETAYIQDANILEIGPGKGILTGYLAESAGKLLAVEIDKNLAHSLSKKIRNIQLVEGDILKLNLPELIEKNDFQNYKVVANLPYYITSKIIRLFLETKYPPTEMTLMVQKEVGERIIALDGKESLLSVSIKFYAEPEILFDVPRENFQPVPEVDSVVIRIKRKDKTPDVDTKKFFVIVRAGFASKRKTLENNLSAGLTISKIEAAEIIKKTRLEREVRAEKLSLENWIDLYGNLKL